MAEHATDVHGLQDKTGRYIGVVRQPGSTEPIRSCWDCGHYLTRKPNPKHTPEYWKKITQRFQDRNMSPPTEEERKRVMLSCSDCAICFDWKGDTLPCEIVRAAINGCSVTGKLWEPKIEKGDQ